MTHSLKLALYNPVEDDWADDCSIALKGDGNLVNRRGRSKLETWSPSDVKGLNANLRYVDALEVASVWLRAGRTGVRISPKRLYFTSEDLSRPDRRKEFEILGQSSRPPTNVPEILKRVLGTGDRLIDEGRLAPCQIDDEESEFDALQFTQAFGKNEHEFSLAHDLWKGLREAKVFSVPDDFKVMVVVDESQPDHFVNTYVNKLFEEWLPELGIADPRSHLLRTTLAKALQQIHDVEQGRRPANLERFVFLVPVSGKPGDPLPAEQRQFLEILDRLEVPYRCVSFDNTQPKWSARSQAISILQGFGGIPYRLRLPLPSQADDCLFFGVDIGHDHRTRRVSRLVVSVLDNYGLHIVSTRMRQDLNEAAADDALRRMLKRAREAALSRLGTDTKASIVVRDGMIPKTRKGSRAESLDTYFSALGSDTTVLECRKRGNPYIYVGDSAKPSPGRAGNACSPIDSDVRFLCSHDTPFGLASVLKLHIPKGADGLSIGLNVMTEIMAGLCYSPSLGLRPHLPGPVYWADGIGSTAKHQYRFAGQPIIEFMG
jgi:hypothetical protein